VPSPVGQAVKSTANQLNRLSVRQARHDSLCRPQVCYHCLKPARVFLGKTKPPLCLFGSNAPVNLTLYPKNVIWVLQSVRRTVASKMSAWPFPRHSQLSNDFDGVLEEDLKNGAIRINDTSLSETHQHMPGEPTVSLEPRDLTSYLCRELLTPDLNMMQPYLWLVGIQDSSHISSLQDQIVKGRNVIITERAELHCTWIYDRIFIKPIPAYLLSWAFWQHFLMSLDSPIPKPNKILICQASLGFLRTYSRLIRHQSDFRIAVANHLIPETITYAGCRLFFRYFCDVADSDVSPRYQYGELRLGRLNLLAKLVLNRLEFQKVQVHYGYGTYFSQFYAPILFLFAFFSVVLSSAGNLLQSFGLDDSNPNLAYTQACQIFSLVAIGISLLLVLCIITLLAFLLARETIFALRVIHRNKRRKWRTEHGVEDGRQPCREVPHNSAVGDGLTSRVIE
jgi:hypothetical protein